jgi:hypothetical protein
MIPKGYEVNEKTPKGMVELAFQCRKRSNNQQKFKIVNTKKIGKKNGFLKVDQPFILTTKRSTFGTNVKAVSQ